MRMMGALACASAACTFRTALRLTGTVGTDLEANGLTGANPSLNTLAKWRCR